MKQDAAATCETSFSDLLSFLFIDTIQEICHATPSFSMWIECCEKRPELPEVAALDSFGREKRHDHARRSESVKANLERQENMTSYETSSNRISKELQCDKNSQGSNADWMSLGLQRCGPVQPSGKSESWSLHFGWL